MTPLAGRRCLVCERSWEEHDTVSESEQERVAARRPVRAAFAPLADHPALQAQVLGAAGAAVRAHAARARPAQPDDRPERSVRLMPVNCGGRGEGQPAVRAGAAGRGGAVPRGGAFAVSRARGGAAGARPPAPGRAGSSSSLRGGAGAAGAGGGGMDGDGAWEHASAGDMLSQLRGVSLGRR